MGMNRIQFQAGLSVQEFLRGYGTETQCRAALMKARWPGGFICPACGAGDAVSFYLHGQPGWEGNGCRKQTSLTSGTLFHATKLPLTTWFLALYFLTQNKNNVSGLELKRLLGISYPAAWRMKHKLMQVMVEREAGRKLEGRVEVDDAYLGGKRPGGKRGRGSENKVAFIAAVAAWAERALTPGCGTVSDGLPAFRSLIATSTHERHVTGGGAKSVTNPAFRWVNTLLGNLKTALSGTYHAFHFDKYGHRYLAEYQYRFNRRDNLQTMLPRLLRAAATTSQRTEAWLRLPEYSC